MLLHDVLDHAVKLWPEQPALLDGDVRLTYRQARERVHRLAGGLLALGLKPGEHIGILAGNSHRYWETYFVASVAGMPLAPLNIRLSEKELEFILNDGEVRALLVGHEYLPLVAKFRASVPGLEHIILLDGEAEGCIAYEALIAGNEPLAAPAREWTENEMLNLCYTGGTTGLPKGVMLSQRNIVSNALHAVVAFGFHDCDVWLHAAPMFHLADAWACYAVTMVGGAHAFIPGFQPQLALETIAKTRVTKTIFVPTMINLLVNYPAVRDFDLSSIETIVYGASPMPVDRILAAVNVFGPVLQQAYGMTETSPLLTAMQKHSVTYDGSEADTRRLASCGREISGVEVRVVDPDTGDDVRPGGVGEVIARGPNVMLGYWKREKETAEALRDGFMHTGDLAAIDSDSYIYIVDRAKDMIITGGENVYSTEVENALYEHPAILEAAVVGVPDPQWGEAVLAIVVPRDGHAVDPQEVVAHCKERIASYKCPKQVVIRQEPLPKSGPGKILKSELRKPYWEGRTTAVS